MPVKKKGSKTKRTIPDSARAKATRTRQHRSIFNRYINSLSGKRVLATEAKIREVDLTLERGTKPRRVPKFVDGVRQGTQIKDVALLPADRARLLRKRKDLIASLPRTGKEDLRADFLRILPEYAGGQGGHTEFLLVGGVPADDLVAAGLLKRS